MATITDLKAALNSWRKDLDVTEIMSRLADYFRVRLEVQRINSAISNITVKTRPYAATHEANLKNFRAELSQTTDTFISTNKKLFVRYLAAFYADYLGSTLGGGMNVSLAPRELSAKIAALVRTVRDLVRKYKVMIDPAQDLRAEVDRFVLEKLLNFPYKLIRKEFPTTKEDEDAVTAGALNLGERFTNAFNVEYEDNAILFSSLDSKIKELEEERNPFLEESATIKSEIVQSVAALVSEVMDYLRDSTFKSERVKIREAIQTLLIDWCKALPVKGLEGNVPEDATRFIKNGLGVDAKSLGVDIENRLREEFEKYDPNLFRPSPLPLPSPGAGQLHPAADKKSHVCNALCLTQDTRCTRLTTNEYCYQHEGEVPGAEDQKLAGIWKMSGSQTHVDHSYWEADLTLQKSGNALWKQTKGANMWAKRSGRWNLKNDSFVLRYRAPKTGLVEWTASHVKPDARQMTGEYRTPEISAHGVGWGGTWNGQKVIKT
jgi:hypothetical protein